MIKKYAVKCNLFKSLYPHTELGVDIKFLTFKPGRLPVGRKLEGEITHDEEDHFTFVEQHRNQEVVTRNPMVYQGKRVNVHRTADGALYPTLKRPAYSSDFNFAELCHEAAVELIEVACLVEED